MVRRVGREAPSRPTHSDPSSAARSRTREPARRRPRTCPVRVSTRTMRETEPTSRVLGVATRARGEPPRRTTRTTRFVRGLILLRVPSPALATQIDPALPATASGSRPTRTTPGTRPVLRLTRKTCPGRSGPPSRRSRGVRTQARPGTRQWRNSLRPEASAKSASSCARDPGPRPAQSADPMGLVHSAQEPDSCVRRDGSRQPSVFR